MPRVQHEETRDTLIADALARLRVAERASSSTHEALWIHEVFVGVAGTGEDYALTYLPVENSQQVKVNGATQVPGVDYTVADNVVTLLGTWDADDAVHVHYSYDGDELDVAAPIDGELADTFTRADSASTLGTAETGQGWLNLSGGHHISGGKAIANSGSNCLTLAPVTFTDLSAEVDVVLSEDASLVWRGDVGGGNHLYLQLFDNLTRLALAKSVAGVNTIIAQATIGTIVTGSSHTLRVEMIGDEIRAAMDGVLRFTHTLTAPESAVFTGLLYAGIRSIDPASTYDDLLVQPLPAFTI